MHEKPKSITVAEFLTRKIYESGQFQHDIATAIGYDKPNIITMFKQGKTKVPLNVVGPLAKVLDIDPIYLFRLVMSEYCPDTFQAVEKCLGSTILTKRETTWIEKFRKRTLYGDPEVLILSKKDVILLALV